jgi:hypothetical protein
MRKLVLIALLVAVAGVVLALFATYQRRYILSQATQAEMVGLHQILDGIAAANQLATNGVFIALDRSIFDSASGVARSAAVTPSAPEATLRSTVIAMQQRAPFGQRTSQAARLLSSEIV